MKRDQFLLSDEHLTSLGEAGEALQAWFAQVRGGRDFRCDQHPRKFMLLGKELSAGTGQYDLAVVIGPIVMQKPDEAGRLKDSYYHLELQELAEKQLGSVYQELGGGKFVILESGNEARAHFYGRSSSYGKYHESLLAERQLLGQLLRMSVTFDLDPK